jgi:hypothetical protein
MADRSDGFGAEALDVPGELGTHATAWEVPSSTDRGAGDRSARSVGSRPRHRLSDVVEVSAEVVERYRNDGATVIRSAIDPHCLATLDAAIERDIAEPGPFDHSYDVAGGRFHGNLRIWQHDADFAAFCLG